MTSLFLVLLGQDHNKVKYIDGKKKYLKVGFLDDARRLNVAFSRAKKKLILVGNEVTLTDSRSHFDVLFNYTNLFRKLVQLSKNSEMGNFINIADYHSGISPFEKVGNKHKEGGLVNGYFKSLGLKQEKMFGAFFYVEGFECLLPISFMSTQIRNEIKLFEEGHNLSFIIHDYDEINERVTLKLSETKIVNENKNNIKKAFIKENFSDKKNKIWDQIKDDLVIGEKAKGKVVNQVNFGFFIKLENEYEGLLHNKQIPENKNLKLYDLIEVEIFEIDYKKQQISLKL